MSGLVFAGIAPHGSSIIKEIAGKEEKLFEPTRDAMEELGSRLKAYKIDTIIILTPHGLRLQGYNAIYTSSYCSGSLTENDNTIYSEFTCDKTMSKEILQTAKTANNSGKRVALIASANQAHAHAIDGIYGYDPAAVEYDNKIISIVKENRLDMLLGLDMNLIENAKPDSLWQMLILFGALSITPMRCKLISYQVPTYFGILVASCESQ